MTAVSSFVHRYDPPPARVIDKQLADTAYHEVCVTGNHHKFSIYISAPEVHGDSTKWGRGSVEYWDGSKWTDCHQFLCAREMATTPVAPDAPPLAESAFKADRDRLLTVAAEIVGVKRG